MKTCKAILVSLLLGACPAVWAQYNAGTNDLRYTNINRAVTEFANAPTDPRADVYLALTRLLALPTDPTGSNFLNRLQIARTTNVYVFQPRPATNSNGKLKVYGNLNADEFTAEIRNDIIPALGASETNLAQISESTFIPLFMPGSVTHFSDVTIDYGDVQMLRAILSAATVFGYTLHSWNLDAQFGAVSNIVMTDKSVKAVLDANPALLTIANPGDLAPSRAAFTNAIHCYMTASQFIRNRQPGQRFLFNLDMTNANDVNAEANFRLFLADLGSSLTTPFGGTPAAEAGAISNAPLYGLLRGLTNHTVSMGAFFNNGFNVRSLLPTLTSNSFTFIWDSFPDTNLGGVLTGLRQRNLDQGFLKAFHAEAQLAVPGLTCQVVSTVGKNVNLGMLTGAIQGTDGNFYGTTMYGGNWGYGAFFQAKINGGFTLLYSFGGATNQYGSPLYGGFPSSLALGNDGSFYGTTSYGGTNGNNQGTIFKINTTGILKTMYTFGNQDSGNLRGGNPLVLGKDLNFYGTTPWGGDNGEGAIFRFTPPSSFASGEGTFTTLASFPSSTQVNPMAYGAWAGGMIQGADNYFYGATQFGGDYGAGSLFQFIPNGNSGTINTGYSFPVMYDIHGMPIALGINPAVQGANGIFYGTTQYGGDNISRSSSGRGDGFLYCIDTNRNFTNLFSFNECRFDGYNPIGALVQAGDGALYGMTSSGGANRYGTIFRYPLGGRPCFEVWFDKGLGKQSGNNGGYYYDYYPTFYTGLIKGASALYGVAPDGGFYGNGTLFSLSGNVLNGDYPPSVSTSPVGGTEGLGAGFTMTVSASGTGTLGYQWRKNGTPLSNSGTHITGATTEDLTLSGLTLGDAGSYTVVVKNNYGSITSTPPAVLIVVPPPTITKQPATPALIAQGQTLSLSVGATNPPGVTLTWQWVANNIPLTDGPGNYGETISGSATSNLVISTASAADSGNYYVAVSNAYTGVTSLLSRVTVGIAPNANNLVVSPDGTNGLVGSNVTLTVSGGGTLPLSYHWFKNMTMPLASGGRVTGATSNKLTLSALALADTGSYSVVVTNAFGKATSMVAVLIVRQGPIINTQPLATVSIIQGQPLNLKVVATGSALTYQWTSNNVNLSDVPGLISGSANSNLVINPASTNDSASYSVIVTNSIASVTSRVSIVTVKVDTFKPTVTISSPPAGARTNEPVTFKGTASESAPGGFVLISNVTYWITNMNGAATMSNSAVLTAGTGSVSNWTVSFLSPGFSPPAGSNVFAVQCQDFSGNTSAVVSLHFFWKSPARLTVITNSGSGNGKVKGTAFIPGDTVPADGAMLNVGEDYSITATPGSNSYFTDWTGTAGTTNGQTLHFIMENDTTLNANFITNIYTWMAGHYNGLFSSDVVWVSAETAGYISGLTLGPGGSYSATVSLGASSPGISGTFTPEGNATNIIRTAEGTVKVQMAVEAYRLPPRTITGEVIGTNNILLPNGTIQHGWTSYLYLVASLTNSSSFARAYTVLIPPSPPSAITTPTGYGYLLLANNPATANVTLKGMLADGTPLSQVVPIGEDNSIPVFPVTYTGSYSGLLWGKLRLADPAAAPVPSGYLTWIRKASASGLFKAGFTNDALAVRGSPWSNSVPLTNPIVSGSLLTFSGGNLSAPLSFPVSVSTNFGKTNLVPLSTVPKFTSASVNTNSGQLTIIFTNSGARVTANGAILQIPAITTVGGGFFTMPASTASPTNAGSITLTLP
ncbi:MAG: choice-of-anchor tandem repeat GloVer-containing protein, partial [Verrucomicrobiota bacterium]